MNLIYKQYVEGSVFNHTLKNDIEVFLNPIVSMIPLYIQ